MLTRYRWNLILRCLRGVDSVTLYAKRLPNTPEYILRIAKPEDYLFTK